MDGCDRAPGRGGLTQGTRQPRAGRSFQRKATLRSRLRRGLHVIAYRAMVDVPRKLVQHLGRLLATERHTLGTRPGTRTLTCIWFDDPSGYRRLDGHHEKIVSDLVTPALPAARGGAIPNRPL